MALRPLIRPRPRVATPSVSPAASEESLEGLPRVLSRVSECYSQAEQPVARTVPRQPTAIAKPTAVKSTPSKSKPVAEKTPEDQATSASKPTLPAFWKSRKVLVAASILALVSAVAVGYKLRPKQQVIVVHPAKQPSTVAATPASSDPASNKPAFHPLSPAATPSPISAKETTSTASLMPRATWPAEKPFTAAPAKSPAPTNPAIQTATKPVDTRTSSYRAPSTPVVQENLPAMSSQFPQTPNSGSNPMVVYNPTMNGGQSPLASGVAPQNNLPPQFQSLPQNGSQPMYTAARPNMSPNQPQPPQDGSFGAYGGARFEGQIQPLPLRR